MSTTITKEQAAQHWCELLRPTFPIGSTINSIVLRNSCQIRSEWRADNGAQHGLSVNVTEEALSGYVAADPEGRAARDERFQVAVEGAVEAMLGSEPQQLSEVIIRDDFLNAF